ncbi:MAG: DUF4402 domain-containing protein [Sphingomonadales bacterium]|nr:DUF4402 domain-containing protein [Sphingomonadales bacterium]
MFAPALIALLLLAAPAAMAQSVPASGAVTTTGTARATIVAPLTLVKSSDMSFGRIAASAVAGTVTVDGQTNACVVTGGVLETSSCQAAVFTGMGTKNMNARISLTAVNNLTGPGTAMALTNVFLYNDATISFAGNPNANGKGVGLTQGNGNQRYSIISNSGVFTLKLGGTLNVNANQAPGVYTGSITVTVQYQ